MNYNAELFNRAAAQYDESPPFFRILGARLVDFAELPTSSSVLDIGAGKGAVTLPALAAVGPTGTVTALEVAGQMVDFLEAYSIPNLTVIHQDIMQSMLPGGACQVF
jgi:16S rRNA A1518/A1519 N6-dimethyltransferase RsmA/KsgA/DIM1 with predicted DNA glycosylase/AP lyase activity